MLGIYYPCSNMLFNILPYVCMGLYKITVYRKLSLAKPLRAPRKKSLCAPLVRANRDDEQYRVCSHGRVVPVAVHQQHTGRPAENGRHGQVRPGQVRGGGRGHAVPGQDPHPAGGQGAHAEADRRAAGRARAVPARAHTGRAATAAAVEAVEGVLRVRLGEQDAADASDDGAGHGRGQAGQRDVGHAGRVHQGAGEQPGERAQQPAGVGKVYGAVGLSAGRPRRQVRVQTTSVLVSGVLFFGRLFYEKPNSRLTPLGPGRLFNRRARF